MEFDYFNNNIKHIFKIEPTLRIFIMTHKDFENFRYNPAYTIVADDKSVLKNKYKLKLYMQMNASFIIWKDLMVRCLNYIIFINYIKMVNFPVNTLG